MPSVGMRRSTRAFVPKNAESGRVLRSGRKLLLESSEPNYGRRKAAQNPNSLQNSIQIAKVHPNSNGNRQQRGRRVSPEHQDLVITDRRRRKVTLEREIDVTETRKVTSPTSERKVTLERETEVTEKRKVASPTSEQDLVVTNRRQRKVTLEHETQVTEKRKVTSQASEQDLVVTNRQQRKVTLERKTEVIEKKKVTSLTSKQDLVVTNRRRRKVTSEHETEVIEERKVNPKQAVEVVNKSKRRRRVNSEQCNEATDMDTEVGTLGLKRKEIPQLEEDLMRGTFYVRKKSRKSEVDCQGSCGSKFGILGRERTFIGSPEEALDVVVESSQSNSSLRFTCFLVSVLKFRSSRMALPGLAALLCNGPIFKVFSHHGVHFMPALSPRTSLVNDIISPGFCRIFRDQPLTPLVWLDFLAAPRFFGNLHTVVFLRSLYRSHVLPCFSSSSLHRKNVSCHPSNCILSQTSSTVSGNSSVKEIRTSLDVDSIKIAGARISTRPAITRKTRKKRSSQRSKRVKNSSSSVFHSTQRVGANEDINANNSGTSYRASLTFRSNVNATCKVKRDVCHTYEAAKPTVVGSKDALDSLSCNANVLVIDSDRCFREDGARVSAECSTSKIWHVVVKVQGSTKYMHRVRDEMKFTTNRYTRAMIWTSADGWKLEYCDRKDWYVFKELYKECWDKNLEVGSTMTIPVPGVREVTNYDDGNHVLFSRPDSYITVHDSEVERAFKKKEIYDIDRDDEEWLEKLNSGLCNDDIATAERLSAERFEKMIDILEKDAYHSHGDVSDENKLTTLCSKLGEDKIVTAVYQYWLNKRKQKGPLLKVFERRPSLQAPGGEKNFLNKKRLIRKQVSQNGRDNNIKQMSQNGRDSNIKQASQNGKDNNASVLKPCLQIQKKKTRRAPRRFS